jgi:cytochrome c oxidase subunit 2
VVFTAALAVLLAACTQEYPYNSLAPAGPVAERQADLFFLVFWIAVAVFVLVEGALLFALIRFRRRRDDELPKQVHGNTRLEVMWTIIPAVLLAALAFPTISTIFQLSRRPVGDVVNVEVIGHQWWWEVHYPDLQITTANEIHVPAGTPVAVELTSAADDVIHSFHVPRLFGKQDLIPGRITELFFEAPIPGTYLGQCAEYCGLSHQIMLFRVVADDPGQFEQWVEDQGRPAEKPPPGSDAADGLEVFSNPLPQGPAAGGAAGCIACHTIDGVQGAQATVGPNLTHFGSRQTVAAFMENTPENVAAWLSDPPDVKPGSKMPDYNLTDEQIEDLVAYLESLR